MEASRRTRYKIFIIFNNKLFNGYQFPLLISVPSAIDVSLVIFTNLIKSNTTVPLDINFNLKGHLLYVLNVLRLQSARARCCHTGYFTKYITRECFMNRLLVRLVNILKSDSVPMALKI